MRFLNNVNTQKMSRNGVFLFFIVFLINKQGTILVGSMVITGSVIMVPKITLSQQYNMLKEKKSPLELFY